MTKDPTQAWLNAAGRFPLLPKTELIRLAKKRDQSVAGSPSYIKVINKITEHNLRLVPSVVRKYIGKRVGFTMSSEVVCDLLQQGYIGLRRAAEKYDPSRGYAFSTYAHSWIYQSVTRWHNSRDRVVYVPESAMTETLYRIRHGKPSKGQTGRTAQSVCDAALRSMSTSSIDVILTGKDEDQSRLVDMLGEGNRLIPTTDEPSSAILRLRELMAECQIDSKAQDVVIAYAQRGRMSIVAAKLKINQKVCRSIFDKTLEVLKTRAAQKAEERAALVAVRLKSN